MNYTLHQLNVYLKVCRNASITRAARELNLSQPAVSIQLKNFQDQFNLPLIEVIGKKVCVTEFGEEIASAAEKILREVEEINHKIQEFQGLLTGTIKLSVVSTGKYVMPYFVSDFFMNHPGLDLIFETTNKSQVVAALKENTTDFALLAILPENLDLESFELLPNHLFLVGNKNVWNSRDHSLSGIFEKYPYLFREAGSATRRESEKYLAASGAKIVRKIELSSNEAVKQAVLAGMGVSIIPLIGMKNQLIEGSLKIIPLENLPIVTTWRLVWLKNKALSPASRAFLSFIKEQKDNIVTTHFDWIKKFI
ncbi:MAG: LysR family transcriptional regulator [Saprospiraceae bacterium]|nr:LysR family transcriptional regulator [Saprospiraceae bacterium]